MSRTPKKTQIVYAIYDDKVVNMDYIADAKHRFSMGCYRVRDNANSGYVVEGEKVYRITPAKRMAMILHGEEADAVLAKVLTASLKALAAEMKKV